MSLARGPNIRCATDRNLVRTGRKFEHFWGGNCRENEFLYPLPDGAYWEASFI